MRNFNEVFRKDVTYDNIKSHKKQGFPFSPKKFISEKITVGLSYPLPPIPPQISITISSYLTQYGRQIFGLKKHRISHRKCSIKTVLLKS